MKAYRMIPKYFGRINLFNKVIITAYRIQRNNFCNNVNTVSSTTNFKARNDPATNITHTNYVIKVDNNKVHALTEVTPFDLEKEMFVIRRKMMVFHQSGNYQAALDHALDLEDRAKKLYPNTKNAVYASFLNNSALMLKMLGQLESAMDKYIEALQVYENVTGRKHTSYASTLANLGVLYKDMSREKKGLEKDQLMINCKEALQDSLELRTQLLGPHHKDTLYSTIHMASYHRMCHEIEIRYGRQNKDQEENHINKAEQLLLSSLAHAEKNLSEIDIICATIHNDLGLLYKSKDQCNRAKDHYLKALNIRSKVLGDEHPETIVSSHNLAELYHAIGDTKNEEIIRNQLLNMVKISDEKNSSTVTDNIVVSKSSMATTDNIVVNSSNNTGSNNIKADKPVVPQTPPARVETFSSRINKPFTRKKK